MPRRKVIKKNNNINNTLVLVTCFYILKNKFNIDIYKKWMKNFLPYVEKFKLIIFCDNDSYHIIKEYENNNIKIIIKEIKDFYLYKYKEYFIKNHQNNHLLKDKIDWKLNLLWCEKCYFVKDTINNNYFQGDYFGWCDIGYFRSQTAKNWPNKLNLEDKIYYNSISNYKQVKKVNNGIDPNQNSICGGFFIGKKDKLLWWSEKFEEKLKYYINNQLLIKDDQTIIVDCVLENDENFKILFNSNWFNFIDYFN